MVHVEEHVLPWGASQGVCIREERLELSQRGHVPVVADAECGHIVYGDNNLAFACEVAVYMGKWRYSCLKACGRRG